MELQTAEYKIQELLENIYQIAQEQNEDKKIINSPEKAIIEAILLLNPLSQQEKFGAIFLDTKATIIKSEILFYGTINQANVYPREIFRKALQLNATTIIICHNHPSGKAEISREDKQLTTTLVEIGKKLELEITDHIIIATEGSISVRGKMGELWNY